MDVTNLAELYDLPPLEWAPIEARLAEGVTQGPGTGGPDRHTCWLATIDPDGRPHVTGVGLHVKDEACWFVTGETTRKGRNLARDPRCTISVATHDFDVVLDGEAHLVDDPAVVESVAATARTGGWPAAVDDSGLAITAEYSAPSAGPPPWRVYRFVATAATAVATIEPGGATHWRF
jgi:PPOX class probable F420-dependent enzyme